MLDIKLIWFIIGLILFLAEFVVPGLIIIFFGFGAWVVCLLLFFGELSVNIQILIFIIASLLSLVALRHIFKTNFYGHVADINKDNKPLDDFIGQQAEVIKDIDPVKGGKVSFHGTRWNASSDSLIPKGTTVKIIGNDSINLKVEVINK